MSVGLVTFFASIHRKSGLGWDGTGGEKILNVWVLNWHGAVPTLDLKACLYFNLGMEGVRPPPRGNLQVVGLARLTGVILSLTESCPSLGGCVTCCTTLQGLFCGSFLFSYFSFTHGNKAAILPQ